MVGPAQAVAREAGTAAEFISAKLAKSALGKWAQRAKFVGPHPFGYEVKQTLPFGPKEAKQILDLIKAGKIEPWRYGKHEVATFETLAGGGTEYMEAATKLFKEAAKEFPGEPYEFHFIVSDPTFVP